MSTMDIDIEDTTTMTSKNVMVLVDATGRPNFDAVADAVERSGVRVERVLRGMKTIVGVAKDERAVERVRHLSGVSSVREDSGLRLPTMDPSKPQ